MKKSLSLLFATTAFGLSFGINAEAQTVSKYEANQPNGYAKLDGNAQLSTTFGVPPAYLGNVATRMRMPDLNNTGAVAVMSRTMHISRQNLTSVQVVFPNFYVNSASNGEQSPGAAAVTTASIEYPSGICTPFKFSGAYQGSIAGNSLIISDALPVSIPSGTKFWIRQWYNNPVAVPYTGYSIAVSAVNDAANYSASSETDATQSCATVTSNFTGRVNYPLALLSMTNNPSAILFGDSRVVGVLDTQNDATGDVGELERFIGPGYAYINMSVFGDQLGLTLASTANRQIMAQWGSFAIDEYGVNDVETGNKTSAQVVASRQLAKTLLFPNIPVYGTTLPPYTTTTDSCATLTNQTVPTNDPQRVAFNTAELAGITGEVGTIDLNSVIDPTGTNKWPVGYSTDCQHENSFATGLEKASTVWNSYKFFR